MSLPHQAHSLVGNSRLTLLRRAKGAPSEAFVAHMLLKVVVSFRKLGCAAMVCNFHLPSGPFATRNIWTQRETSRLTRFTTKSDNAAFASSDVTQRLPPRICRCKNQQLLSSSSSKFLPQSFNAGVRSVLFGSSGSTHCCIKCLHPFQQVNCTF
jgi:hypothetical protein